MEEKKSTISGSPENTDSGSPTPISSGLAHMALETHVGSAPQAAAGDCSGTTVAGVGSGGAGFGSAGSLIGKKKRGRPRKYDLDGNLNPAYLKSGKVRSPPAVSSPPGFTLTMPSNFGPKKGRGRSLASGNWQQLSSLGELFANTAGGDFTPHVITVQTGEDVAAKILLFSQKGPRGICVLSANGAISNVTIRQPGSSGGLLTYEGRFEILSLTGSYTASESGGVKSRTGGLSISLAGPDGRVVGGSVAGWLTAASPIQVVVGSFMPNGNKACKRKYQYKSPTAPVNNIIPALPVPGETRTPATQAEADPQVPAVSPLAVPGGSQSQSRSEADDSIGSGHNLNDQWNPDNNNSNNHGLEMEPSSKHTIYPSQTNVSMPGLQFN